MPDLHDNPADRPPQSVARTATFLSERGVWFTLGRNHEARSCRDAAQKRTRLGEIGIPLWDELKSFFGVVNRDGRAQHLVVHCRGDRELDLELVAASVGASDAPERCEGPELERLGMAYGLVNPFEPWAFDGQLLAVPVLQVFDRDLLTPIGVPGTVMTNAGDLTWSVELRAAELATALDHTIVADVSRQDPGESRPKWAGAPSTFGIITGNGPDSGMLLWRSINRYVNEAIGKLARGDFAMPRVIVHSLPELGLTMELDSRHEAVWPTLRQTTAEMCRDGANVIAVACNTTPHFAPELRQICAEYGAEFVSMPEVVGSWLHRHRIDRVSLLGVKTVAELGPWSPYREPLAGVRVDVPDDYMMERLHAFAYEVKAASDPEKYQKTLGNFYRLVSAIESDVVVVALTELSLLLEHQRKPRESQRLIVDAMKVYAAALAARHLGLELEQILPPLSKPANVL